MQTNEEMLVAVLEILRAGHVLIFGEYRGCKVDPRLTIDRTTRKVLKSPVVIHLIETGRGPRKTPVRLTEWLDEARPPESYRTPWQKGKRYGFIVATASLQESQPQAVLGRIEVLEVPSFWGGFAAKPRPAP